MSKVITLCGSSRFKTKILDTYTKLSLEGNIVLLPVLHYDPFDIDRNGIPDADTLELLSNLHLQKIDMSDEIFVINQDGYIGFHTSREIARAKSKGIPVRYLES